MMVGWGKMRNNAASSRGCASMATATYRFCTQRTRPACRRFDG